MNIAGLPHYQDLDVSGEAAAAAARMEARAREPASAELFAALVEPLLPRESGARILEVGGGTGALGRKMAAARPGAQVFVTDKSAGMLRVGEALLREPGAPANVTVRTWDVLDEATFPFPEGPFDLIVSSVMVPYLGESEVEVLVPRLAARLRPGGTLVFVEQDLLTDSVNFPDFELFRRVYGRDERQLRRTLALGLRPVLRAAGLELLPRASFLWTDSEYGAYTRDLLARMADDAVKAGRLTAGQREAWFGGLEKLAGERDFQYGLVYHRIAGRRAV